MIPEQCWDYQRSRNDAEVFKQRIKAYTLNGSNAHCENHIIINGGDCRGDANDGSENAALSLTCTAAILSVFTVILL